MSKSISPSVLASVFSRNGEAGKNTKLFDDFQTSDKQIVLNSVSLREDEKPIVGHIANDQHWCLVTTSRVIWSRNNQISQLENDDITECTIDEGAALGRQVVDASDLHELKVIDRNKRAYTIEIEPGRPFSGVWNTLKFIARRNS